MTLIKTLGQAAIARGRSAGYALGFFGRVVKETFFFFGRKSAGRRVLVMQMLFTGVEALGISAILAVAIGAIVNIVGLSFLGQLGQTQLMYNILFVVISRELGPLLTAFIIIARSGTAIATELAGMVISHEIEAYITTGIDPLAHLAVPRFLGVTFSCVLLTIYFNAFGLLGSYAVLRVVKTLPLHEYLDGLLRAINLADVLTGLIKSFVFGILVSIVATYQGFSVSRSSTEIPQAGIRAVGQSFVAVILADAVIVAISYML